MAGMVSMSLGHAQNMTEPMTVQDSTALRVKRITVLAACLPGAGQMVNRQFWRSPSGLGKHGLRHVGHFGKRRKNGQVLRTLSP